MAKKPTTKQLLTVDTSVNSQRNREMLLTMFPKLQQMVQELEQLGCKVEITVSKVEVEVVHPVPKVRS